MSIVELVQMIINELDKTISSVIDELCDDLSNYKHFSFIPTLD